MMNSWKEKGNTINSESCNTKLLYLHGFNSSPFSPKGEAVKKCVAEKYPDIELIAPELPPYTMAALELIKEKVQDISKSQKPLIIASSMGGFFTNFVAHDIPVAACFVNPGVDPFNRVKEYLDIDITNPYSQKVYRLNEKHIEELQSLYKESVAPNSDFYLFLKTGDEVLDYSHAAKLYKDHKLHIDEGGDHSFHDFDNYVEEMIEWLISKK